jgi:hypothetical protein
MFEAVDKIDKIKEENGYVRDLFKCVKNDDTFQNCKCEEE